MLRDEDNLYKGAYRDLYSPAVRDEAHGLYGWLFGGCRPRTSPWFLLKLTAFLESILDGDRVEPHSPIIASFLDAGYWIQVRANDRRRNVGPVEMCLRVVFTQKRGADADKRAKARY
jgi:hypothetical protein